MPKPPIKKNGRVNKTQWIRSLPVSLSAKDVVAKGKAEGIGLSLAQVYTARSTAKTKPAVQTRQARQTRQSGSAVRSTSRSTATGLQAEFLQLARRIGTVQAEKILRSLSAGNVPLRG